jgi:copper chaperone CopZ
MYRQIIKTENETMNQSQKLIFILGAAILGLLFTAHVNSATVHRSHFIVSNLSCTSCLATIETELRNAQGALGMDADLRRGRVTVDHLSTLHFNEIAATISRLGYPARMEWTATLPNQYSNRFGAKSSYRSGCSSGGCSGPGSSGPTAWKKTPASGTINRTTLQVSNLSCTSCLTNIGTELQKLSETFGMNGYLSRGIVIVDHEDSLESSRIAAIISDLGYPARPLSTNEISAQNGFRANPEAGTRAQGSRPSIGCNSKGPCNATSAAWQKLYNRYFTQKNSN